MKNQSRVWLLSAIALILLALWVFPVLWVLYSSFKPSRSFGSTAMFWIFKPTLDNYRYVFSQFPFFSFLRNSIIASGGSTILSVCLGSLAGYSIARFRTGGRALPLWILSTRMLPPAAMVLPFFMIFRTVGLTDSVIGLVICYLVFNLSFATWMTESFFRDIPVEIEEAAKIDGCSTAQVFRTVVLPISLPGIVATSVFCMITGWNEFVFALVLTDSPNAQTLPVSAGMFLTEYQTNWGPLFAETVLIIAPILAAALFMQKHIVRGMSLGAIKS